MKYKNDLYLTLITKSYIPLVLLSAGSMIIHLSYMIFFLLEGIYIMGIVNIFSVLFYAGGIFIFQKGEHNSQFLSATIVEILAHSILATLFTGWEFGFEMFIICMIPVPYMLSLKKEILMHIAAFFTVSLFVVLRIFCCTLDYTIGNYTISVDPDVWYIFNGIVSFFVIIAVTYSFRFRNIMLNQTLAEQNAELVKAASVDSLTGLFNRRAMSEFITQISTINSSYCAVLLDIDFFKKVNDTYGHQAGDMVLVKISEILQNTVPSEGFICRWGGEELLFLIPTLNKQAGTDIAEKVRVKIENESFEWENRSFNVTATLGVSFSDGSVSADETIKKADNRLYFGKENGRNQVVTALD